MWNLSLLNVPPSFGGILCTMVLSGPDNKNEVMNESRGISPHYETQTLFILASNCFISIHSSGTTRIISFLSMQSPRITASDSSAPEISILEGFKATLERGRCGSIVLQLGSLLMTWKGGASNQRNWGHHMLQASFL